MDCKTHLIYNKKLTGASVHDSQIELTKEWQVDLKDKAYYRNEYSQINGRMKRASRNHPLNKHEQRRNHRISQRRSPGERPYSFAHRINNKHTIVTTKPRAETEITLLTMLYNTEQIIRLEKNKNNTVKEEIIEKELESEDIDFKFSNYNLFQNSSIYYEHEELINACIDRSPKKYPYIQEIYDDRRPDINRKLQKTITPSKSDYRRQTKRSLNKIRKNKKKKLKIMEQNLFSSLNLVYLAEI
jgi:hypothetical protein